MMVAWECHMLSLKLLLMLDPIWSNLIGVNQDMLNGTATLLRSGHAAEGEDYLAYLDLLLAGKFTEQ